MEISVVARTKAKPGCENALEQAFKEAVQATHQEIGCQRYALHRGIDDPSIFIMIERWDSSADLDQHLKTSHIQTLFSKIPQLVISEPEILKLNLIPAGDQKKSSL